MKIPIKKLKTGFEMPVYGMGTWRMGGGLEHDTGNNDKADVAAIKYAIDNGITHIDTAEIYADGYSEKLVGQAIKDYDRSKLFIVSKVEGDHQSYDGILKSCRDSLERINTSYLDLYLLHWYSNKHPLNETIKALNRLVSEGLVKNIGVSNFNVEHLKEAQSYSKNKIVCDQVHYNLTAREPECSGLLEYCQNNDVFIVAWRPLGKEEMLKNVPTVLNKISEKYNKTVIQVAINWLISQDNVITLSKTRKPEHLKENLDALGWQMESKDIERLRKEFPNQQDVSDAVPLG